MLHILCLLFHQFCFILFVSSFLSVLENTIILSSNETNSNSILKNRYIFSSCITVLYMSMILHVLGHFVTRSSAWWDTVVQLSICLCICMSMIQSCISQHSPKHSPWHKPQHSNISQPSMGENVVIFGIHFVQNLCFDWWNVNELDRFSVLFSC